MFNIGLYDLTFWSNGVKTIVNVNDSFSNLLSKVQLELFLLSSFSTPESDNETRFVM